MAGKPRGMVDGECVSSPVVYISEQPARNGVRPHPHSLVGREGCSRDVCEMSLFINDARRHVQFNKLGIQCSKHSDFKKALDDRELLKIDPFNTGFEHKYGPRAAIDPTAVRLCFEVYSDTDGRRLIGRALSDVIVDKKFAAELCIVRASHCSGSAGGGTRLILLCEKVNRDHIAVVFYQKEHDRVVWEQSATIVQVHKQFAIVFMTPPYLDPNTCVDVDVFFQLMNIKSNARSNPLPFEYIADSSAKRRKNVHPMLQKYTLHESKGVMRHQPCTPLRVSASQTHQAEQDRRSEAGAEPSWPAHTYRTVPSVCQQVTQNFELLSPKPQATTNDPHAMLAIQKISSNIGAMSLNVQTMSPDAHAMTSNWDAIPTSVKAISQDMPIMFPNMEGVPSDEQDVSADIHIPEEVFNELLELGINFNDSSVLSTSPHCKYTYFIE